MDQLPADSARELEFAFQTFLWECSDNLFGGLSTLEQDQGWD
jgi:hypothetical protein